MVAKFGLLERIVEKGPWTFMGRGVEQFKWVDGYLEESSRYGE